MPYIFTMTGDFVKANQEFYDRLFAAAKKGDFEALLQLEDKLLNSNMFSLLGFTSNKYFLGMLLCVQDEYGKVPLDYLHDHQSVLDGIYKKCQHEENDSRFAEDTNALYALFFNQKDILESYLKKYPDLVSLSVDENLPRHGSFLKIAAQHNYLLLVLLLIEKGAKVKEEPEAFIEACRLGHIEVAKELQKRGAVIDQSNMLFEVGKGELEFIRALFQMGCCTVEDAWSVLYCALLVQSEDEPLKKKKFEIAKFILSQLQDLHVPFLCAISAGNMELIRLIHDKLPNRDINFYFDTLPLFLSHFVQKTPLGVATFSRQHNVMQYLLHHGARVKVEGAIDALRLARDEETINQFPIGERFNASRRLTINFWNKAKDVLSDVFELGYKGFRPGNSNEN